MSEPDNFLARWSRRKRDADRDTDPEVTPPQAADAVARTPSSPADEPVANSDQPAEFDLASLPSLESIGSDTDMRVFLQKGVPLELTRAALRRAWTVDPTIRDFIGIAENQWDFATGDGIPGFGPLQAADDIRRMVADIVSEGVQRAMPAEAQTTVATVQDPQEPNDNNDNKAPEVAETVDAAKDIAALSKQEPDQISGPVAEVECAQSNASVDVALQNISGEPEYTSLPTRRAHGRALPE